MLIYIATLVLCVVAPHAHAYETYPGAVPNGRSVKCPAGRDAAQCADTSGLCYGLGHIDCRGGSFKATDGSYLSPFGRDFVANGHAWSTALCQADSDGDGVSNGAELGDPCCVWAVGRAPPNGANYVLSHPGDASDKTPSVQPTVADCAALRGQAGNTVTLSDSFFQEGEPKSNFTFAVQSHTLPATETAYMDSYFDLPTDKTYYITGVTPLIDNKLVVHHFVVVMCPKTLADFGVAAGVSTLNPSEDWPLECDQNIFIWAPGNDFFRSPPNAAIKFGAGTPYKSIMVQIHYNNPSLLTNAVDASGFVLFATTRPRQFNGGFMWVGGVTDVGSIPPGQPAYYSSSGCAVPIAPTCQSINVLGSTPHAHALGRAVVSEQYRFSDGIAGGSVVRVDSLTRELKYNFQNQHMTWYTAPKTVSMGDSIWTTCVYNSTSRTNTTEGGPGSAQEMCVSFLFVYPIECVTPFGCDASQLTTAPLPSKGFDMTVEPISKIVPVSLPPNVQGALAGGLVACNLSLAVPQGGVSPASSLEAAAAAFQAASRAPCAQLWGGSTSCSRACAQWSLAAAVCAASDLLPVWMQMPRYVPPQSLLISSDCNAAVNAELQLGVQAKNAVLTNVRTGCDLAAVGKATSPSDLYAPVAAACNGDLGKGSCGAGCMQALAKLSACKGCAGTGCEFVDGAVKTAVASISQAGQLAGLTDLCSQYMTVSLTAATPPAPAPLTASPRPATPSNGARGMVAALAWHLAGLAALLPLLAV